VLIYKNIADLQYHIDRLNNCGAQHNIKINKNKTDVLTFSKHRHIPNITINGERLKQVGEFKYLGRVLTISKQQKLI
jgi:hypothetical protein